MAETRKPTSCVDSSFPVKLPVEPLLFASAEEFQATVRSELQKSKAASAAVDVSKLNLNSPGFAELLKTAKAEPETHPDAEALAEKGKTHTTNLAVAHATTDSPLLDLFTELEKSVQSERLVQLLDAAWTEDPLATLKIVFNARSIHLGKGEQTTFYKCIGWMKNAHPETVIANLPWVYRSIIQKTVKEASEKKADDDSDDMELVEATDDLTNTDIPDVVNGGAHGYWKDLPNILVLAVHDKLDPHVNPRDVLNEPNPNGPRLKKGRARKTSQPEAKKLKRTTHTDKESARAARHAREAERYENVLDMLKKPFYRLLHVTIARNFAAQLNKDKVWLKSEEKQDLRKISLAAKWAPSVEGFHDKHTFLVSSIAEILYPRSFFTDLPDASRETYLKHARAAYHRLTLAPLRKALEIVERDISAETFENIKYPRVPSVAMNQYKNLFMKKDFARYEKYIEKVAEGKTRINASILNPSVLVMQTRSPGNSPALSKDKLLAQKMKDIQNKALDGQWNDLVQKMKDSGTLSSAIAVCDVSGSMTFSNFHDGTTPIDTAVGLSLLIAEITAPPYGGSFITFSSNPQVVNVGGTEDKRSFREKTNAILQSQWSMNTNFVRVFEKLLLPIAVKNKIPPEDMVKTVFVFSDMQFDESQTKEDKFDTSHDRIEKMFKKKGYELPRLVYWNINGGMHNVGAGMPKPVMKETDNALMVSGYSSAMIKMFLDGGLFEGSLDDEEEEVEEVVKDESGEVKVQTVKKKVNPMDGVWRAISHKAYNGLKVVD